MALIKCHECGKDVSTEAKLCPGCGAKPKLTSGSNDGWIAGGIGLAVLIAVMIFGGGETYSTAQVESLQAGRTNSIPVPSDPSAIYTAVENGSHNGLPMLISKREGKSGVSYTKKAFDCASQQAMTLGDSDTPDGLDRSISDNKMYDVMEGSITYWQWAYACGK